MKIQELELTKNLKRSIYADGNDLAQILSEYGWRVIGYGVEGAVAEHPKKSYVLKLFPTKSKYVEFVEFVQEHQSNPHLPKFSRYVRKVPGTKFSYVRMEKLNHITLIKLIRRYMPELCALEIIGKHKKLVSILGYILRTDVSRELPAV
jgi:hypothetical protein